MALPPMTTPPPAAPWARATASTRLGDALLVPQAIAHRGYRARFAENSMAAFRGALRAGADAVETDVRLSADAEVVLCHDASLKRCFGADRLVADCAWAELARLRSAGGVEPLARLTDLLAWLAADGRDGDESDEDGARRRRSLWVLLDIKMDDDARLLVDAIAAAVARVPPKAAVPWHRRIMLGCWNATTLRAARRSLPAFALAHIGLSVGYARHFLTLATLALNMADAALAAPLRGRRLLRDARRGEDADADAAAARPVFAWTVNRERRMRWALRQNLRRPAAAPRAVVDGVVTDDPARFRALCRRFEDELAALAPPPPRPSPARAARAVLAALVLHLVCELVFLYRRFWLRRLDYLPRPAPKRD